MTGTIGETYAFFILQMLGGHVGIPIILLTHSLTGIRRHPLVENFLITWVIYTTSFCLLLYTGNQFDPSIPPTLCNIQASLVYGATMMVAFAALAFIINLWSCTRLVTPLKVGDEELATEKENAPANSKHLSLLLCAPYMGFVFCSIIMLCLSLSEKDLIGKDVEFFYCSVQDDRSRHVIPIISGCIMAIALALQGSVAIRLYRMYKASGSIKLTEDCPTASIILRTTLTFMCMFCALIACIVIPENPDYMGPYIFQGALPTIVFIIFGTQTDLLRVWGLLGLVAKIRRLIRFLFVATHTVNEQDV